MSCNATHPWRIQQFHDATHLSGAFNSFMLVSLADRGSPANYSNHVMCMVDLWHSTKVRHYGHNSAGRRHALQHECHRGQLVSDVAWRTLLCVFLFFGLGAVHVDMPPAHLHVSGW